MLSDKTTSTRFMHFAGFGYHFGWGYFCCVDNKSDTVGNRKRGI